MTSAASEVWLSHALQQGFEIAAGAGFSYARALGAKTLPLLLCACVPRRGSSALAALWTAALSLSLVLCFYLEPFALRGSLVVAAALAYYFGAAALVFWLARVPREALRSDVLFCLLGLLGVVLPALFLQRAGSLEMLLVGWSLVLSGYSYCMEMRQTGCGARFDRVIFFLLVDPTLSYPDSARRERVAHGPILRRAGLGLAMMLAGQRGATHLHRLPALLEPLGKQVGAWLTLPLAGLALFFCVYWVRAGAAHARISLMQSIGYQLPECYRQPYRARSPADFWRRWNCWAGDWVRRYLFLPLSLKSFRHAHARGWPQAALGAKALAVMLSFIAMGVLHDWLIFSAQGRSDLVYTKVFAFAAAGLLVWEAARMVLAARALGELLLLRRFGRAACAAAYVTAMVWISGAI